MYIWWYKYCTALYKTRMDFENWMNWVSDWCFLCMWWQWSQWLYSAGGLRKHAAVSAEVTEACQLSLQVEIRFLSQTYPCATGRYCWGTWWGWRDQHSSCPPWASASLPLPPRTGRSEAPRPRGETSASWRSAAGLIGHSTSYSWNHFKMLKTSAKASLTRVFIWV